jgi:tripartite-type tricarboxylate transporter receptor subunit TctC
MISALKQRATGFALGCAIVIATPILTASPAATQTAERFYQGRALNMVIGFDVGGGYDLYARLAARHLSRHVAGKPNVVAQNMPGAGGLTAMNHLYKVANKDGSVIGAVHSNIALGQLLGGLNIEYDARKFNWLGRLTSTIDVHYAWHTTPVKTLADVKARETIVAATGPASNSTIYPRVLNEIMGTRFRVIGGFKGTNDANLAMERGEVEAVLKPWEGVKSGDAAWLRDKKITLFVQYGVNRHPDLPNLPTVVESMDNDEQRQIMRLFVSTSEIGRSLLIPPDVPADRVAALRAGFNAMVKDASFRAEADKLQMEIDPLPGEDMQSLIAQTFDMSPALVQRARELYNKR